MMRPMTEGDLAEIIRTTQQPLHISGGGTRGIGQPRGTALQMGGLSGIRLYEPGALTLVAGAGASLAEAEAALATHNQRLPFEVPDMRGLLGTVGQTTLGGIVAANASGPRRVQAGACRDSLIGLRFVDGMGTIIKNGGRVMKNVTGYDLVKLLAGSWGTLGVLTEVAFKLLPVPETQTTLVLQGLSDAQAVEAMSAALGSPFEVSGAAHLPGQGTFLRLEGFVESVGYRAGRLGTELAAFGKSCETGPDIWHQIRDVAPFHARQGDVWRLSVKPSDAPTIVARMAAAAVYYDWGGGLIWALTEPGTDLRARIAPFVGHATLIRASAETKARIPTFQPEPKPIAALTAALRAKFDPRAILNPGVMER